MLLVGMFDDARSLEEGLTRLGQAGLDDSVQRLEGPPGVGTAGSAGASEGGAEPADLARSEAVSAPWAGSLRAAERPVIRGKEIDAEEQEYYLRLLNEGGRLLVVEVSEERAGEAERLLSDSGATRVARHLH
jgi:hypothetical protein